jgi:GDPmannose 4,6-dehydratase
MFACNGILFNHESPYRGENFVTRKITIGLSRAFMGDKRPVYLGNLNSKRDWGHARDYVEAQWMMLQANKPDDYVVATGSQVTIRDFISICCASLGLEIEWSGQGLAEECVVTGVNSCEFGHASVDIGQKIIGVSKDYFRPSEVSNLLGDSTKIQKDLGWEPTTDLMTLVQEMLSADIGRERIR